MGAGGRPLSSPFITLVVHHHDFGIFCGRSAAVSVTGCGASRIAQRSTWKYPLFGAYVFALLTPTLELLSPLVRSQGASGPSAPVF